MNANNCLFSSIFAFWVIILVLIGSFSLGISVHELWHLKQIHHDGLYPSEICVLGFQFNNSYIPDRAIGYVAYYGKSDSATEDWPMRITAVIILLGFITAWRLKNILGDRFLKEVQNVNRSNTSGIRNDRYYVGASY